MIAYWTRINNANAHMVVLKRGESLLMTCQARRPHSGRLLERVAQA